MLCTHLERDTLIAGGFDGHTYLVDHRSPLVTSHHRYHRGSVLSIAVDDNNIVSVGEDSRLVVVDRRRNETNLVISVCNTEGLYFFLNSKVMQNYVFMQYRMSLFLKFKTEAVSCIYT